ncbi:amyloid beta precursor protein binding family B member 2-like isoform X2 [Convolutriloba macropyga]
MLSPCEDVTGIESETGDSSVTIATKMLHAANSSECVSESDSGVNLNQSSSSSNVMSSPSNKEETGKQDDSAVSNSPCSELESEDCDNDDSCEPEEESCPQEDIAMNSSTKENVKAPNYGNVDEGGEDSDTPVDDPFSALGLPPGWRRMTGDTGVYYWHVESGEISRQIPEFHHSMSHPEKATKRYSTSVILSPEVESMNLPESQSEGLLIVDDESLSLSHSSSQELSKLVESLEMNQKNDTQSLVFPVFGLGSCTLNREDLKQDNSIAISSAIRYICQDSEDGSDKFSGRDFLLVLENEALQVCDYLDNCVLLNVPVAQIRLWGVGKDSGHDFAFVAKERSSGLHYCYAFRSDRSAKAISAALQKLCDKIVAERAAKRRSLPANPFLQPSFENRFWNDSEPAPVNTNTEEPGSNNFATPLDKLSQKTQLNLEECERYNVYYIGSMPSEKPSGISSINEAIADLRDIGEEEYTAAIVHVSPASILITNEENGSLITESRVRYLSFLGIGRDACKFGYIVSTCRNQFICHVLHCPESAGPLAKSVESACKVRYQKVLEAKKRQLLAAPKLTRQQTIPNMMSAISKTLQDAVSASRQSTITDENHDTFREDGPQDGSGRQYPNDEQQAAGQGYLRNSFSSLFGRLSRYTSSAKMSRSDTMKPRPKSQLYDSVIAGSFEYCDD